MPPNFYEGSMDKLTLGKELLKYLELEVNDLPKYLFYDDKKRYPLEYDDERILAHYNEDTLFSLRTARFLKDFSRYGASIDKNTTNKTFLRTAELFRQMGVKNYYFHLQLNNPLLLGIDPWDESLSDEIKFMIMQECQENIWYILREIIKIDGRRFIGNRAVLSFIWCCLNHVTTTILMPRQSGKALEDNTPVKTLEGWKIISDLIPGDVLIAPDGSHTTVNGKYTQGDKPIYMVEFEDGRTVPSSPDHLWKVFNKDLNEWSIKTTMECLELSRGLNSDIFLYTPLITNDNEIKDEFGYTLNPYTAGTLVKSTVPKVYLEKGNWGQRLSFLQGFMDVYGRLNTNDEPVVITESLDVKNSLLYLARSLGMIAEYKYIKVKNKINFHVKIKSRKPKEVFRHSKYRKYLEEEDKSIVGLGIKSFRLLNKSSEATCIEVDHPDHQFITKDFVVTHNTVGMQVLTFILQYLVGRSYKTGLITLASQNRQQFVNAVKKIRSGCPEYLIKVSYKDKDSGNLMTYQAFGEENKNIFSIRVPSGGEDGAENVSRGETFGALLTDEPAWMKYIANIMSGSGPATLTEQKNMLEKGMPWFRGNATTPNSVLKEEGAYMYKDTLESTEWRESFFDSFSESHLFQRLIKASPRKGVTFPKVTMQFSHLQLGFGHEWVKRTMDKLNLPWGKAKIDLLMMWTEEGKNKVFDDKTREKLNSIKRPHLRHEEVKKTGLFIDWFLTEEELLGVITDPNEFFILGVDTSDALGEDTDACTLTIRRCKTGEVVGTGRYSLAFTGDVRDVLFHVLMKIKNSLLVIERNRAQSIIDDLIELLMSHGEDPFKRLYNTIYQFPVENAIDFRDVSQTKMGNRTREFYLKYKSKFGFYTGTRSRPELYGLIYEAVSNTGAGINYGLLIDELIGLETDSNGRIDHVVKGHDDIVISWLLSYWFIKRGINKHLYGMPSNCCLIEITPFKDSASGNQYSKEQLAFFTAVREKINQLTDELLKTDSDLLAPRLEAEIRKLAELVPEELKRIITVDELIENAKKERTKRKIEKRRKFNNY